jgi:NAD(P) transhydrogenase subunit alpha
MMNVLVLVAQTAAEAEPPCVSTDLLIYGLYAFVLAGFLGFAVITKVPPTLHTPLMSGANAISGITLLGALVSVVGAVVTKSNVLGFVAVALATVNVVGGFMVTDRMLAMFGPKKKDKKGV